MIGMTCVGRAVDLGATRTSSRRQASRLHERVACVSLFDSFRRNIRILSLLVFSALLGALFAEP
eukprot:COSAG04_NODE_51_length_31064_cov_38.384789_17_plen_64_part_00